MLIILFFFNDTATTEIYTLSLHDALPIFAGDEAHQQEDERRCPDQGWDDQQDSPHEVPMRSEEHTSELQSRQYIVCRLLLEKKKKKKIWIKKNRGKGGNIVRVDWDDRRRR